MPSTGRAAAPPAPSCRIPLVWPVASIPSPSSGELSLGPLSIHLYGLTLLAAIAACVVLTGVRWRRLGGDWDLILQVAVWGVAAGIVGARLYHVVTSWSEVPEPKWRGVFAVWEGGLGVWGGIALGVLVGAVVVRRAGQSVRLMMDAVAPGLLLAQAIGRIGNWWNQELFGRPSDLPWALEIDPVNRPTAYVQNATFHPTFLYELVYNLAGVAVLLWVGSRFRIRPPALFALYVAIYTFGRFFEELLRIDPSHELGPLRLNAWVSIVVFLASAGFFVWWQYLRRSSEDQPRAPDRPTMAIPRGRVRPSR
ncbi:MAG: prolipoprotein diacylglyceryl transferase [Actinobacteria bacterium]|nr:prolipoprotein diacylglyceryl transferase [Actinomycetota bacterium]